MSFLFRDSAFAGAYTTNSGGLCTEQLGRSVSMWSLQQALPSLAGHTKTSFESGLNRVRLLEETDE